MKKLLAFLLGIILLTGSAMALTLNGAGATFPYPIYSKWFSDYQKEKGVQINYAPIGSGGGIRQFTAGVVDFGASDAPMTDSEIDKAGGDVLHIPTVAGAIAVVYNAGFDGLRLDGETLAGIFLGEIKKWNDDKIAALNPGISLPDKEIKVAHRSDSSGTTDIFTGYLAKVDSRWASKVGAGKSVAWPVGVGGKGNPGVAGVVKNNDGSIGYVELAYAETNNLAAAKMKNKAGVFIAPSVDGTTAAMAGGLNKIPSDFRGEILNQKGSSAYPICGMTWLLVHKNQSNADKGTALKDFLKWALSDGQKSAKDLYYAPLPDSLRTKVLATIDSISTL
ncbi:MAG: phosphate ABC transporter substrate-binding protein PstS [Candidatus Margulisbacteria bacterium]|nr:phosphate ABC transporter substrate-binding protein PstS [Candidatus Margulisiibacteriota bacterium]